MKYTSVFFYIAIILLLTIICSSSVTGHILGQTRLEIAICVIGIFSMFKNKRLFKDSFIYLLLFITFLSLIQYLIYPSKIFHWLRLCLLLFVYINLSFLAISKGINIISLYYKVFFPLCVLSTTFYVLIEWVGISFPSIYFAKDDLPSYNSFFLLYNETVTNPAYEDFLGLHLRRNNGFFTEPGLFSTFIILSLYILVFIKERKNAFHFYFLLFALFTTFSTTGILLFIMMMYYKFSQKKVFKTGPLKLLLFCTAIPILYFSFFSILSTKQENHAFSFMARSYDLLEGFNLFIQSPIWGHGFKNYDVFYKIQSGVFEEERYNSNGLSCLLYQLGIIGSALYFIPYIALRKKIKEKGMLNFFSIIMIFLVMGEPIQYMTGGLAILGFSYATLFSSRKCLFKFA